MTEYLHHVIAGDWRPSTGRATTEIVSSVTEQGPTGFYVEPTICADVDNAMTIAQDEIAGPVLAMIPYDTDADAVRINVLAPCGGDKKSGIGREIGPLALDEFFTRTSMQR